MILSMPKASRLMKHGQIYIEFKYLAYSSDHYSFDLLKQSLGVSIVPVNSI